MSAKPYLHLCRQTEDDGAYQPDWPGNVRLVEFTMSLAEDAHDLMQSSYAMGGGQISEFRPWLDTLLTDAEYDPALVFPVLDNCGRMVAFAQCWSSGFIKDLVVDIDRRQQGLGEALLRHLLVTFRERGVKRVCLKVECDNPTGAERLYRRLGFDTALA